MDRRAKNLQHAERFLERPTLRQLRGSGLATRTRSHGFILRFVRYADSLWRFRVPTACVRKTRPCQWKSHDSGVSGADNSGHNVTVGLHGPHARDSSRRNQNQAWFATGWCPHRIGLLRLESAWPMRFAFVLSMLLQTGATIFGNHEYRSLGVRLADPIDHPREIYRGAAIMFGSVSAMSALTRSGADSLAPASPRLPGPAHGSIPPVRGSLRRGDS